MNCAPLESASKFCQHDMTQATINPWWRRQQQQRSARRSGQSPWSTATHRILWSFMVLCVLKGVSTGKEELARPRLGVGAVRPREAEFLWSSRTQDQAIVAHMERRDTDSLHRHWITHSFFRNFSFFLDLRTVSMEESKACHYTSLSKDVEVRFSAECDRAVESMCSG